MKREKILDFNWRILKIHNDFFRRFSGELSGVVVDLGCGSQPFKSDIRDLGCRYVSVDWSNSYHQATPDILADLNVGVDLPDDFADSIITFSVLEHLHSPARLVGEAYRILKPNGMLFMQVPFQWAVHEAPYDYFRFTKFGLQKLLEDAGFMDIEIKADCGYWGTTVLKFNYHTKRLVKGPKFFRILVQSLLTPFWLSGQILSIIADRLDPDENETASYTVGARKISAA